MEYFLCFIEASEWPLGDSYGGHPLLQSKGYRNKELVFVNTVLPYFTVLYFLNVKKDMLMLQMVLSEVTLSQGGCLC